ncbi:unnamed protein product [Oppiella nova]|uniref:EGF-like domain-containing protein n=1 Tax=Oppiella nova TaxID=334625 RepID=A0A7R9QAL1_9ACAR|nr:unnamed protein product [Oppiella nova]CAG2162016.1 unnamed protein product [Oppiella nova]
MNELMSRCCQPWIKSKPNTAHGDKALISRISRLPNEAIKRNNSPTTHRSYKNLNNNSSNTNNHHNHHKSSYVSSLYLNSMSNMYSHVLVLLLIISFIFRITEACSSRSTPKPRPPSPTTRPNITFQTYACPEAYAKWYCLNGATCFSVRIGESILYNCECADGYMGQRCEFKDLDGSYLPSREKVLVETASIAGGVTVAVLLMVFISIFYYNYLRHRKKESRLSTRSVELNMDQINRRPFGRVHSLRSASTTRNVLYSYDEDFRRIQETKRLQDPECGDNSLVPYVFKPKIVIKITTNEKK